MADEPTPRTSDAPHGRGSKVSQTSGVSAPSNDDNAAASSGPRTAPSPADAADAGAPTADGHAGPSFRKQVGMRLSRATDAVNDNLVVVRYATVSSVLLLGMYGVANTPLFYRYTNLLDIPSRMYLKRKWIHGRLVGVMEREAAGGANAAVQSEQRPIVVLFRHSSPMERLLTQSAMEKVLSFAGKSPSRLLYSSANPYRNLLPIELAGVAAPPTPSTAPSSILSTSLKGDPSNRFPLLDRLIGEKTKVSLQLLARRTARDTMPDHRDSAEERRMPEDEESPDTAICHLHYRKADQWITTTNASVEMVTEGQACLNPNGAVVPLSETGDANIDDDANTTVMIADFDPTVKQLQQDATFISRLEEAEYAAWQSKKGMWSSDRMRATRREYVEEEESAKNGWRAWVRRGLGWLSGGRV